MKALRMSLAKDLRRAKVNAKHAEQLRAARETLHNQAIELVKEYPHTGPVRRAMWAIGQLGVDRCRVLAGENLSAYWFAKKVAGV